jgi:hypothetical protein
MKLTTEQRSEIISELNRAPQVKKEAFHGQTVVGGMLLR